jgi:hypothetical protein
MFNAKGLPPYGSLMDRNSVWHTQTRRASYTSTRAQKEHPCSHLRIGEGPPPERRNRGNDCSRIIEKGDVYLLVQTPYFDGAYCLAMPCAITLGIITYGADDKPIPSPPRDHRVFCGMWEMSDQFGTMSWLWEWAEGDLRWEVGPPGFLPWGFDGSDHFRRYATRDEAVQEHGLR